MDFAVTEPAPALQHCFSLYYQIGFDYPLIEDLERADVGYIRFMFNGSGNYEFSDGTISPAYPATLLGPGTVHARYFMNGPLQTFGAVLLPEVWAALGLGDASDFANRTADLSLLLGPDVMSLHAELAECPDMDGKVRLTNAWFLRRLRPLDKTHRTVIKAIGDWLSHDPVPSPDVLYETAPVGPRQVMRLANRYFGAPPKLLARKYRALRTASLFVGGARTVTDDMLAGYADRAHLSREVKHFTGLSPRDLIVAKSPIMQVTLSPGLFNYDAPWR